MFTFIISTTSYIILGVVITVFVLAVSFSFAFNVWREKSAYAIGKTAKKPIKY